MLLSLIHFFLYRVTLYAEFLPAKQRGRCVILLDVSSYHEFIRRRRGLKLFIKYIILLYNKNLHCSVFGLSGLVLKWQLR